MSMFWDQLTALLRQLPAEPAHNLAIAALRLGLGPAQKPLDMPVHLAGLTFRNPLGLAAGFDKHAQAIKGVLKLGFGFTETGTITPLPQPGNARPRVFRLTEDGAVINRYGFNSHGMAVARAHLAAYRASYGGNIGGASGLVGVNIGANKTSADRIADYYQTASGLSQFADYLTVNISSPNTPGLRDLQTKKDITQLLDAVKQALDEQGLCRPIFVKLAPDLEGDQLKTALDAGLASGASGFILTNTTISRPDQLASAHRLEQGGLSGQPLALLSTQILSAAYQHLKGSHVHLIGVGGVASGRDAYAKILAGADLVQLYSALSLYGPSLVGRILNEMAALMRADGLSDISQAKGQAASAEAAFDRANQLKSRLSDA